MKPERRQQLITLVKQLGLERLPFGQSLWWPATTTDRGDIGRAAVLRKEGGWCARGEDGTTVCVGASTRLDALQKLADHVAAQETDDADDARWIQEEGEVQQRLEAIREAVKELGRVDL